ncbi:hypothetical protein IWY39_000571 [Sphingobium sp. JAI105]|uniref:hypothetical protein n=1 Tax=Sphingobium sp. JAI105 TaxID=2787715 RepID=UPI0018C98BC8|nr:hypothetical protein [Sphingobium sp. JAI105]MBG6116767.1 hypothetical protein [Sphingobium sp. JAI105]
MTVERTRTDQDVDVLSDADVLAIWLEAADPEHPTPREEAALQVIEARNLDL